MLKLFLYVIGCGLIIWGAWSLLVGLLYVLGGSTFADPGPVLVRIGAARSKVGLLELAGGIVVTVVASEWRKR